MKLKVGRILLGTVRTLSATCRTPSQQAGASTLSAYYEGLLGAVDETILNAMYNLLVCHMIAFMLACCSAAKAESKKMAMCT